MRRRCPHGHGPLERETIAPSRFGWRCAECGGHGVDRRVLEGISDPAVVEGLAREASRSDEAGSPCPSCRLGMAPVDVVIHGLVVTLDVCHGCRHVWLDAGEFEQLPRRSGGDPEFAADLRGMARTTTEEALRRERERETPVSALPDSPWSFLAFLHELPIVRNPRRTRGRVSVTLVLLAALLFVATLDRIDPGLGEALAFVPDHPTLVGLLGSFFVHAGLGHLIANAIFLLLFGRATEQEFGSGRFVVSILVAHLAACAAHAAIDPRGDVPLVGASGGISGVVACFALSFPRARIGLPFLVHRWLRLPALAWLTLWCADQALGAVLQVHGIGTTSAVAHLGGVAGGVAVWGLARLVDRRRGRRSEA
ncbi:MAG: rhomboid family intramembrane serine protease [Planctomycetota bacterium JB042]